MRKEIEPVYQWEESGNLQINTRNPDLEVINFEVPRSELVLEIGDKEILLQPVTPQVRLLGATPDIERLMAAAGKSCYSSLPAAEIFPKISREEAQEFLCRKIIPTGHHSVIEHGSFTFDVSGVSRAYSHQQVRHRIASYSQQSQRYVNPLESEPPVFKFVVPPTVRYDRMGFISYIQGIKEHLIQYGQMIAKGEREEDARMFLPNAAATNIVVSMNPRALFEMATKRTCALAQWEIDMVVTQMVIIAYQHAPSVFETAGPYCSRERCPEGKRSCGVPIKPIPHYIKDINEKNFPHDHLIFKR